MNRWAALFAVWIMGMMSGCRQVDHAGFHSDLHVSPISVENFFRTPDKTGVPAIARWDNVFVPERGGGDQ